MLGCCIRREPCLINDDCVTTTHNKTKPYSVSKKDRVVVSPILTPDYMIDLEAGLNAPPFVVYEPRVIHNSVWGHGIRIAI